MRPDLHLTQPQPQPSSPLTILHGGVAAISKQQQQQQQRKLQLNIELRKCKGEGDVEGEGEEGGDERLMKLAPPSRRVGKLKIFSILHLYANYRSI